jgi:hypothetical protein
VAVYIIGHDSDLATATKTKGVEVLYPTSHRIRKARFVALGTQQESSSGQV